MADETWRRLEREAVNAPDDLELAERACRARIRAGDVASLELLKAWLWPELDRYMREVAVGAPACGGPTAKALLKADPAKQVALLGFVFARLDAFLTCRSVTKLLSRLLSRTTLPVRTVDLLRVLEGAERAGGTSWAQPWTGILRQVELCIEREGIAPELRKALLGLEDARLEGFKGAAGRGTVATKAKRMIGAGLGPVSRSILQPDEPWADVALAQLSNMSEEDRALWTALLEHAAKSKSGQPSQRWVKQAEEHVAALGPTCGATIRDWFVRMGAIPGEAARSFSHPAGANRPIVRGLAWSLGCAGPESVETLVSAAAFFFAKVPDVGPRSRPLGNACLTGLSLIGSPAVPALEHLREQVHHDSTRTSIDRALARARGERLEPKKRTRRAKKKKPVEVPSVPFDQADRDRDLVSSLLELEGLRPMQRMFVDDVKRTVIALKGSLSAGQRKEAQALLAAKRA